jgi:hypothetical protein
MSVQILKDMPISDKMISADVFLGFVLKMSLEKIKGMERSFGLHLAMETAERMLRLSPKEVEPIFETRLHLLYQEKSGFIGLFRWFFAKSRMRRKSIKNIIEAHRLNGLTTIQITEKQAMGYLLLAAKGLDFLTEQIRIFEIETHLLMRTASQEDAKQAFNQLMSQI